MPVGNDPTSKLKGFLRSDVMGAGEQFALTRPVITFDQNTERRDTQQGTWNYRKHGLCDAREDNGPRLARLPEQSVLLTVPMPGLPYRWGAAARPELFHTGGVA